MQKVRVGIVGMGARGYFFADYYSEKSHPGFELVAACDLNPAMFDRFPAKFRDLIPYYGSLEEMLAKEEIDAVIVATNDPYHVEPTITALKAGKHVLCEKPLCQTVEDAQLIARTVQESPGIFMVGFELREATIFRTMRRLLDEGRIGRVMIGHCFDNCSVGGNYYYHNPDRQKDFYKTLLLQKGTHSLDLLNWFMGSHPVKVYGMGGMDFYGKGGDPLLQCRSCDKASTCPYFVKHDKLTIDGGMQLDFPDYCVWSPEMNLNDNSELAINYANGSKATFHESHFTPDYSREFWLVGTKGKMYAYYDNPGRFLVRIEYTHAAERRTEEFKPHRAGGGHGGGDFLMRDEFYRRIVENDPAPDALESAYYSTVLAICAEESIESGMPVDIPPLQM